MFGIIHLNIRIKVCDRIRILSMQKYDEERMVKLAFRCRGKKNNNRD